MDKNILDTMWNVIPQIKTPIAFGAFAIAALTLIARSRRGRKTDPTTIAIVAAIVIIGALVLLIPGPVPGSKTYLVRVTTLNPGGMPIEGAKVHTTVSNETSTATDGSATFAIPEQSLPDDRKIVVFANAGTLNGRQGTELRDSVNVSVTLRLAPDLSGSASGLVEDDQGNPIAGAQVALVGGKTATTDQGGQFRLDNIGAAGEQVRLHTSKQGFSPNDDYYQLGSGATIQLTRRISPH
ncbi:MAG: hypothetical protein JWR80_8920 [Bradyrhizobium sp.]|nr:hypothetical protein [Bradyrhizobium sp.]